MVILHDESETRKDWTMIMKNPDDSVLDEQSGANENASGTEEKPQAEKAKESESPAETEKAEQSQVKQK